MLTLIGFYRSAALPVKRIDLDRYVGVSLEVMESDSKRVRGERPFVFTNLKERLGLQTIIDFIVHKGMLRA